MLDNKTIKYLGGIKAQIEKRNETSDNKNYHINEEKKQVIKFLNEKGQNFTELEEREIKKILKIK